MILAASDVFPADTNELGRKAKVASLLTAVNLAFRGKGIKGCEITEASIEDGESGVSIITICAKDGDSAATIDDVRAAFKRGAKDAQH